MIVLDIGHSMGELSNNTDMTGLDKAKKAFRLMVQQKLLFGYKQDVCSVVLFNSKQTNNVCHDEHGGYESIEEYFELNTPNLDLLECIDNVQCNPDGKEGDGIDALLVAAQIIINYVGTKKFRKRIFMITDAATPINDVDQIQAIAESFCKENIQFYCIGIGFGQEEENDDEDVENLINSFNDIKIINTEHQRTEIQTKNEKILRYFSHLVNGNIFSATSAIKMMSDLRFVCCHYTDFRFKFFYLTQLHIMTHSNQIEVGAVTPIVHRKFKDYIEATHPNKNLLPIKAANIAIAKERVHTR